MEWRNDKLISDINNNISASVRPSQGVSTMGSCCVKQQLTEEDIKFLKKHTRYDEETIRTDRHTQTSEYFFILFI